ncbi:PREDICTED: chromatin assembly factor 1 subunit A-A-like [Priapulus caudatus]|uniref:Chromatin assembly factor 1 subunit A-A-like n=1 Tax=Priapulus caudatus TaxID=37621 RepID=A0ABM1ENZ1_PRICU|nr:PREDICTED: chromatin assembly factor 1 subunit A-A-like [Priapulus caudatus]
MPYEVKKDQRLAPVCRRCPLDIETCDNTIAPQTAISSWFSDIKLKKRGFSKRTWPRQFQDIQVVDESCPYMKVKLLQFYANYRPAYYGTWRKKSNTICGRNPFKTDLVFFDYDVESDDEWEEEEPGEDIDHSEGEDNDNDNDNDNEQEDDDDEDDGFLVPHGYLSDDEGADREDENSDANKVRMEAQQQAFHAEMKRKCIQLKPVMFGCHWSDQMTDNSPGLDYLLKFKVICNEVLPVSTSYTLTECSSPDADLTDKRMTTSKAVPDEAFPDLVRLLHGNRHGIKKLVMEFREYWRLRTDKKQSDGSIGAPGNTQADQTCAESTVASETPDELAYAISKRQLEKTITAIATREKRTEYTSWYVSADALKKYSLPEPSLPNDWEHLTISKATRRPKKEPKLTKPSPSIAKFTRHMSPESVLKSVIAEGPRTPVLNRGILNFVRKRSSEGHSPLSAVTASPKAHPLPPSTNEIAPDLAVQRKMGILPFTRMKLPVAVQPTGSLRDDLGQKSPKESGTPHMISMSGTTSDTCIVLD